MSEPQRPEPRENWDWHTSDDQPQRPEPPLTATGRVLWRSHPTLRWAVLAIEAEMEARAEAIVEAAKEWWPDRIGADAGERGLMRALGAADDAAVEAPRDR